jgi:hypothetical protein
LQLITSLSVVLHWERLKVGERKNWNDWLEVARALVIGRAASLAKAVTNLPQGSRYNHFMGGWLQTNGLDGINTQERYRAMLVLESLSVISAWRDGLDEPRRRRMNHPNAVWHAWRRSTQPHPHAVRQVTAKPKVGRLRSRHPLAFRCDPSSGDPRSQHQRYVHPGPLGAGSRRQERE